jgi:large subunit ribosomal protein L33
VAKKSKQARDYVTLQCTECDRQTYRTSKKLKGGGPRLELKKYCKFDRKHTVHKDKKK